MSGDAIKIEVSQESVQQIIKAKVNAAVMEALLPHKEQFVREIVERSLCSKSTADEYRYKNEKDVPTVLEHMVRCVIAEEAKAAIKEWAQSHRQEIADRIRAQMQTQRWSNGIAAQIAQQMAEANEYRFKIEVTPMQKQ